MYNGIDLNVTARMSNLQLQAGSTTGHRVTDYCGVRAQLPALFIDCGREDGLVDQNRALHWELTRLGVTHRYAEWPGAHTWRYWSTHVRESLAWMGGEIGR